MLLSGAWQFRYSNNALICGVCLLAISKIEAQTQQIQAIGNVGSIFAKPNAGSRSLSTRSDLGILKPILEEDMKKISYVAASIVLASSGLFATAASAEVSYNVGWASEYHYRGIFQKNSSGSAGIDYEESGFYAHIMSKFKLKNDQEIQLSGGFSTPMKINTGEISAMKSLDISYKKDITDKFNIMLTVKDIFDTREFHIITDRVVDGINEHLEANHRWNRRFFKIAFEYKFGAFQEKKYIREDSGHDYEEEGGGMDVGY